jgi:hypothetical protein
MVNLFESLGLSLPLICHMVKLAGLLARQSLARGDTISKERLRLSIVPHESKRLHKPVNECDCLAVFDSLGEVEQIIGNHSLQVNGSLAKSFAILTSPRSSRMMLGCAAKGPDKKLENRAVNETCADVRIRRGGEILASNCGELIGL